MRAHLFIDGANIYRGAQEHAKDARIDYKKLVDLLAEQTNTEIMRTHFYTAVPKETPIDEKHFLDTIEHLPNFEVKTKPLRETSSGQEEKEIDVLIATDMLWNGLEGHYEHAILASGDEDLTPAVKRLKDAGLRVTVAAYKKSTSHELVAAADTYIDLSKHQEELRLE